MPTTARRRIPTTLGPIEELELDRYIRDSGWRIYETFQLIATDPAAHRAHTGALWAIPERLRVLVREHCNLLGELFLDDVLKEYGENGKLPRSLFGEQEVALLTRALGHSVQQRYEALAHHMNASARHEVSELPGVIEFRGQTNSDGTGGRLWIVVNE